MKSLEARIDELERKSGARVPAYTVNIRFVPATTTDGRPCPAPEPYETITLLIGKPEVPTS